MASPRDSSTVWGSSRSSSSSSLLCYRKTKSNINIVQYVQEQIISERQYGNKPFFELKFIFIISFLALINLGTNTRIIGTAVYTRLPVSRSSIGTYNIIYRQLQQCSNISAHVTCQPFHDHPKHTAIIGWVISIPAQK